MSIRKNLPSASSMERHDLCSGSFLLEQSVAEKTTNDSDSGTKVHAWLAGQPGIVLTDEELKTAERCTQLADEVSLKVLGVKVNDSHTLIREQRLWIRNQELDEICSGQGDIVQVQNGKVLIQDFKSLWGEHTAAPSNWQLRTLVGCAYENFDANEFYCSLIQPHGSPQSSICRYSPEEALQALRDVAALAQRVKLPNQPRTPSEKACRFCRAKAICPEARQLMQSFTVLKPSIATEISKELMPTVLDRCDVAELFIEAIRDEAKARLTADPQSVPGYQLKPGKMLRPVIDAQRVYDQAITAGLPPSEFIKCVTVGKEKLEKQMKLATGLVGKNLDHLMTTVLAGALDEKQSKPSLAKI